MPGHNSVSRPHLHNKGVELGPNRLLSTDLILPVGLRTHKMDARETRQRLHTPRGQEVGPDVDRLVVHLEAAEDAVQRRAPWVAVSGDDAVLPEHLRGNAESR